MKLGRLFRTVRYLRPVQIYGRLWFRLYRPQPDTSPAPEHRPAEHAFERPAARRPSMTGPGQFMFLGHAGDLAQHGWDGPEQTKLWRYNQHYFDDLNAQGSAERSPWHHLLMSDWVANNPPGHGSGWEPYTTSLRIVNWVKWGLSGQSLSPDMHTSLAVQSRWLMKRLERHLLGNHFFSNAKALMFAGLYFQGDEGHNFRKQAIKILEKEIPEQILPDGGHFERSTMYHALALEDILDLLNLWHAYGPALSAAERALQQHCVELVPKMLNWLAVMSHPDGGISFFNDTAFGIAPDTQSLYDLAERLGFVAPSAPSGFVSLAESGYGRLACGPAVVMIDVGEVGPSYLPGHAHADSLSCEVSVDAQRIIVNSGTSEYGTGPERLRQRGTPAHSTVTVAHENSSEVWSGFRVGRRAKPLNLSWEEGVGSINVRAAHDGYRHLSPSTLHHRSWTLTDKSLLISDQLDHDMPAQAFYHLHPDVKVQKSSTNSGILTLSNGRAINWHSDGQSCDVVPSTWHPHFGTSKPSQCLCITLGAGSCRLELTWG